MKKWKCEVCGYIHDGDEVCDACPKCGAMAEKFVSLEQAKADLIERSRHTNALHAQLIDLARQIDGAAHRRVAIWMQHRWLKLTGADKFLGQADGTKGDNCHFNAQQR